jgi:hypothetical protein
LGQKVKFKNKTNLLNEIKVSPHLPPDQLHIAAQSEDMQFFALKFSGNKSSRLFTFRLGNSSKTLASHSRGFTLFTLQAPGKVYIKTNEVSVSKYGVGRGDTKKEFAYLFSSIF